jgi:hypothetical protein
MCVKFHDFDTTMSSNPFASNVASSSIDLKNVIEEKLVGANFPTWKVKMELILINNIIYNIFMEVKVYLKPIDVAISTSMEI